MNASIKPKKKALGRGLSALISSSSAVPVSPPEQAPQKPAPQDPDMPAKAQDSIASADGGGFSERIRYLPIKDIQPNPNQPRQIFSEEEINELSDSINRLGLLQPIMVRPSADGKFEIVAGERRWRAATKAKLMQVPAIIRDVGERELLEIAIVENIQRSNLSALEEAAAYQKLIDEFSLSQREVAESVGKDRASIANFLRLLKLPDKVQQYLNDNKITMGHAKAILTVKEPGAQLNLANKVIDEGLSVRALEAIVSRVVVLDKKRKAKKEKKALVNEDQFPDITERLRRKLGTKVRINHHPSGRGRIEIEYFSESELDRILELIS